MALILVHVGARLFFRGPLGEIAGFEPLDGHVGRRQLRPQRVEQHAVVLRRVQRGVQRLWQALDAPALALVVAQVAGVHLYRLARIERAADAVQPGGQQRTQRQVRVAAMVRRLQLQVGGFGLAAPKRRGNADGAFAVVEAVRGVRRAPEMRQQPPVRVGAGAGDGDERRQMGEHAADELVAERTDAPTPAGVVQPVAAGVRRVWRAPEAEVDVRAAARLIQERLGGERGQYAMPPRDAAHCLAHAYDVVRGPQRLFVADGELLLARAKLRHELLDLDVLPIERADDVVHDLGGGVEADAAVAEAAVDRLVAVGCLAHQVGLMLY